jgi:hypothetical protein
MTKTRLIRPLAAAGTGLALALGGVMVTAVPAAADTPGCVTKKEYHQIHKGMTKKRVHRIFDTHRSWLVDSGSGKYTRTYQSCDLQHAAWITYKRIPNKPDRTTGWKDWTGAS